MNIESPQNQESIIVSQTIETNQIEASFSDKYKDKLDSKFSNSPHITSNLSQLESKGVFTDSQIQSYITDKIFKSDDTDMIIQELKKNNPNIGYIRTDIQNFLQSKNLFNPTDKIKLINQDELKSNFDFNSYIQQIKTLSQSPSPNQEIDKIINEQNKANLLSVWGSAEFDSVISDIRKNPLKKENVYILQIIGKTLIDTEIAVDGIFGKQTETVLRYIQTQGVGGKKIQTLANSEQKITIQKYITTFAETQKSYSQTYYEDKSKSQSSSQEEEKKPTTSSTSINNIDGQSLLDSNSDISSFVSTSKDSDLLALPDSIDNNILKKYISDEQYQTILTDAIASLNIRSKKIPDYQSCFDDKLNLDIPSDQEPPKKIDKLKAKIDELINIKIGEISTSILSKSNNIIKKEAIAGCINIFRKYMDNISIDQQNFTKNFDINPSKDLKLDSQNNFLEIKGNINGSPITYKYFLDTGKIVCSEILHKNSNKGFDIGDNSVGKGEELPIKLPSLDNLIQNGQKNITADFIDSHLSIDSFEKSLSSKLSSDYINQNPKDGFGAEIISRSMEKNYAINDFFDIIGQEYKVNLQSTDSSNSVYKLFDIITHSLDYYTSDEIQKFRLYLKDLKSTVLDKYSNPNYQSDNSVEKTFVQKSFSTLLSDG